MNEIIPDTSKYTDLPSRFRALALIAEAHENGEEVQYRFSKKDDRWHTAPVPAWNDFQEYRIKPKPRELWAVYEADGSYSGQSWETEDPAKEYVGARGRTVVRFVEQPE